MVKRGKVRVFMIKAWFVCFFGGVIMSLAEWSQTSLITGLPLEVNVYTLIMTLGWLVVFSAVHYLVFTGQAKAEDLSELGSVWIVYSS